MRLRCAGGWTSSAGYTLIELVVVMALMLVMAAISMPAYGALREKVALEADALQVVSVLRAAQAEAITDQLDHHVVIDMKEGTYRLESFGDRRPLEGRLSPGTTILPPPATTFSVSSGIVDITYEASGWGTPGTLALRSVSGSVKKVVIQVATGRAVIK